MAQDDNQDRDRQSDQQPEGWQQDEQLAREGRSEATPQDRTPAADDLDDMDEMDEDRDDDDRNDGSPNRRNSIG
jgi:hypothetical protein